MTDDLIPNTEEQEAYHRAQEEAAAEEATWPLYRVMIIGDKTEWVPRPNPTYWNEDGNGNWVPKDESDLPDHASINANGHVEMEAVAVVTCRARSLDHAKMKALQANPNYHTVSEVQQIEE